IIATLFAQAQLWPPAVVSDADHAWRTAINRPAAPPPPARTPGVISVHVGSGIVSAVCFAPQTGDVFLGFESGAVACFRPTSGEILATPVDPLAPRGAAVTSLAADADGQLLVVLREGPQSGLNLTTYTRSPEGVY